jgi:hypothetical protein
MAIPAGMAFSFCGLALCGARIRKRLRRLVHEQIEVSLREARYLRSRVRGECSVVTVSCSLEKSTAIGHGFSF